jgi:hypothetical protein
MQFIKYKKISYKFFFNKVYHNYLENFLVKKFSLVKIKKSMG